MIFIINHWDAKHLTVIFLMQNQLPQLHDLQGQAQQKFQSVNLQQATSFSLFVWKTYLSHMHVGTFIHTHTHTLTFRACMLSYIYACHYHYSMVSLSPKSSKKFRVHLDRAKFFKLYYFSYVLVFLKDSLAQSG